MRRRRWCARADRAFHLLIFANGAGIFPRRFVFGGQPRDNDWLRLTGDDRGQIRVWDGVLRCVDFWWRR
jgi:hypothetical protein